MQSLTATVKDTLRNSMLKMDSASVTRYEVHIVGASHHAELWVPAEELEEFNSNIVGEIRVIKTFE